jgi:hypothetical protein
VTPARPTLYHTLVPHPREPKLLLLSGPDGWSLPHWTTAEPHLRHSVRHINEAMQRRFGLETTVLRRIHERRDPTTGQTERVYALENHARDGKPPAGAHWVDADGSEGLRLAVPEHRSLLRTWFDELEAVPARRLPWARPGWFGQASGWVRDELARAGIPIVGPIEQLRTWQRSCILRATTARGEVFFKAVPPMFASEPPLTQALAEQHPAHMPRVLAIDPDRRWLLMEGVKGESLDRHASMGHWESALVDYARIQIAEVPRIERSLALGCPDRRLDRVAADIAPLLQDPTVLQPGQEHGLDEKEISCVQARAPQLEGMCAELATYSIPASLEHGDFYAWQILVADERPVYIDWSDCSVAHPFFSLLLFFEYAQLEQWLPAAPEVRQRLLDAYLEPWTVYEPMDRLRAAFDLAQTLASLHHAALYQQRVLPNLEDPWEWEAMAPWFLKMLLAGSGGPEPAGG